MPLVDDVFPASPNKPVPWNQGNVIWPGDGQGYDTETPLAILDLERA